MDRSNETWMEHLRGDSATRDAALGDLRALLIGRLGRALGTSGGVDDAFVEDVAQEALVHVLKNLDQFEGRSRFTTWTTTIAVRLAFTQLRRRHWKDVSLDQVLADTGRAVDQAVDAAADPHQQAAQKALIETVYRVIDQDLTQKQRHVLLAELKGMPQEEIGRHMASNRNAIYKLTHDARKKLKAGLEASGYTVEDIQAVFGWNT